MHLARFLFIVTIFTYSPGVRAEDFLQVFIPSCDALSNIEMATYCQQIRASDIAEKALSATENQNNFAFYGLLISSLGAGLAALSTVMAFWASISAAKASRAAAQTLESERAWICPQGFDGDISNNVTIIDKSYAQAYTVFCYGNNYGRSPAINVLNYSSFQIIESSLPVPIFTIDEKPEDRTGVIPPGQKFVTGQSAATLDQVKRIILGELKWYIHTYTSYETIYSGGRRHVTETVYQLEFQGNEVTDSGRTRHRTGIAPVGKQNRLN